MTHTHSNPPDKLLNRPICWPQMGKNGPEITLSIINQIEFYGPEPD